MDALVRGCSRVCAAHRQARATMTPSLREQRAEKRKQEILEAALLVMTEDGYNNASLDRIAERALLTRVGLYKHFKDKAALVTALRAHKLLELAARVEAAIAAVDGLEAQVTAVVRETVAYQTQNTGFFRVLFASSFSHELAADTSLKPYLYAVARVFEALPKAKRRGLEPLDYAGLLAGLAFEPSVKRAFVPLQSDYVPPPQLVEAIARIFLHGILG
jgi:AcrR family transcriptional regulator